VSEQRRYFGTDGIRGAVGCGPITADFVLRLGWAAGRVLAMGGRGRVLIGKDTRISGYMFESALEAGLSAAGVDVRLLGPMPTPAIAYLTRTLHARAGIVISASHNTYSDNGIKFFDGDGGKLPDEVELEIERMLDQPIATVGSRDLGKAERVEDAAGRYIEFCKSTVPHGIDLNGMRIVVDCAHGATYHIAPSVFDELGAEVVAIGCNPDGLNINHECGAVSPAALQRTVSECRADLGIAFDGDGDRVVMVDHAGEVADGDDLLYVIAMSRQREGLLGDAVVGTVMSNLGLEEALSASGVALHRAKVGDRHVLEMMRSRGAVLGGETSGHIICLDRVSTGDGIVAALQVLAALQGGAPLHEARSAVRKHPQVLHNVPFSGASASLDSPQVCDAVRAVERELAGHGRVLLRPSGTEPVVRVMVEGPEREQVEACARRIGDAVRGAMSD